MSGAAGLLIPFTRHMITRLKQREMVWLKLPQGCPPHFAHRRLGIRAQRLVNISIPKWQLTWTPTPATRRVRCRGVATENQIVRYDGVIPGSGFFRVRPPRPLARTRLTQRPSAQNTRVEDPGRTTPCFIESRPEEPPVATRAQILARPWRTNHAPTNYENALPR